MIDSSQISKIIQKIRKKYFYYFIFILLPLFLPFFCIQLLSLLVTFSSFSLHEIFINIPFIIAIDFFILLVIFLFSSFIFRLFFLNRYSSEVRWNIIKYILDVFSTSDKIKVMNYTYKSSKIFDRIDFFIDHGQRFKENFYIFLSTGVLNIEVCELSVYDFSFYRKPSHRLRRRLIGMKIHNNSPIYSTDQLNLDKILPPKSEYMIVAGYLYVVIPLRNLGNFDIISKKNYDEFVKELVEIFDIICSLRFNKF